ncbi:Lytic transglycosylase [Candidatus Desulfarcum epimagneticum]|uniref:Lytic transglycosylase n=1 Tax=uncultured Desulfobacteraceae bacterium TaxID=218296 RepID=A0A484HHR7_9BACT|nr:Lytic transglycosylase [uncultured Desulfobacteraceae bacterium]
MKTLILLTKKDIPAFLLRFLALLLFFAWTQAPDRAAHARTRALGEVSNPESGLLASRRTDVGKRTAYPVSKKMERLLAQARASYEKAQSYWEKNNIPKAFKALDAAYSLLLGIPSGSHPEYLRRKKELRFLISRRNHEIYVSRGSVVNGKHKAIPIVLNRHVKREITRYATFEKNFFIESYKRSGKYRPMILRHLKKEGVPEEISWLPLIESGFKITALSKARALGLWQFIPSTGYKFGLKRDLYVDERLDPIKSTKAAIAYLKELHKLFGDWITAIAAYNCGEGKILSVIRDQKVNYLDNFWDLYKRLPRETAQYVPRFMATLHMIRNPEKYGISLVKTESPLEFDPVTISKRVSVRNVAKAVGSPEKLLKELNPELRYEILPQELYTLRVPPGSGRRLLERIDDMPVSSLPQPAFVKHRVRPGETLSDIARKHRVSVKRIARANNIRRSNLIVAGKTLKIPLGRTSTRKSSAKRRSRPRAKAPIIAGAPTHIARPGDSLWTIARRYGTTAHKIRETNGMSTNRIQIGQRLKIPGTLGRTRTAKRRLKIYTTRIGDSPFTIAKRHNMPLTRFLKINNLDRKNKIFPGQTLYVDR